MDVKVSKAVWFLVFLLGFLAFSIFVYSGHLAYTDLLVTEKLQSILGHVFDLPFSILSLVGSAEVTVSVLILLLVLFYRSKQINILFTFFVFAIGSALELSAKLFLFHPSPPSIFFRGVGILFPSSYIHTNYSYPSGHIFRITFIVLLVYFNLKKLQRNLFFLTLLLLFFLAMVVSRIYLGEHWFSDVVGGFLLGTLFALGANFVMPRFNQK